MGTAHQSITQYITDLHLPLNQSLYVVVLATNNAGLQVREHSAQFIVDDTPPQLVNIPLLSSSFSLKPGTQFDRSVISLDWLFQDDETPIWSHSVSVHTHHDNQGPLDGFLVRDVHQVTISLPESNQMKDGNRYVASVTACNGAILCKTAQTAEFLIDSSPPHLGGFVEPLSWKNSGSGSTVLLSWEGFDDAHSGITQYHIMISSTYNGYDLSDGILNFPHNSSVKTQQGSFDLNKEITPYSTAYLSIWAENGVGRISDAAKVGVFALKSSKNTGQLDIEKHSCDVHYCNKDCTCAVVNRQCSAGPPLECEETNSSYVKVYDGSAGRPITMTASVSCLQAFWKQIDYSKTITRYEWTVGAKGSEPGSPIFDLVSDKIWFDVELLENSVYCLPGSKTLTAGLEYVYYIKAWHNFHEYSLYNSDGIIVDSTPPRIGMGKAVRDMDAAFQTEVDFIKNTSSIHTDWASVFGDTETGIDHYEVSVGTTPGGNEIYGPTNFELETRISLTNLSLIPGFSYFTTVHAYNPLGMATFMSSDGVVVDTEPPLPGVVYSSLTFQNAAHHTEQLSTSWHGFEDLDSYIKNYELALGKVGKDLSSLYFQNVGLETSIMISKQDIGFEDGVPFIVYVRAFDAAGHLSPIVASKSINMDASPPIGQNCTDFVDIPGNWSFFCSPCDTPECSEEYQVCRTVSEIQTKENHFTKVTLTATENHASLQARLQIGTLWDWIQFERKGPSQYYHYTNNIIATETAIPTLYLFKGKLVEVETKVQVCEHPTFSKTALSVQQSGSVGIHLHWAVTDPESDIKLIEVGLGSSEGGFQLLPLTDVGQSSSILFPVRLQHGMEVHSVLVAENHAGLKSIFYGDTLTVDWSPPVIHNLQVDVQCVEDKCSVGATWDVTDVENVVQDCHWSIGRFDFQFTFIKVLTSYLNEPELIHLI